MRNLDYQIHKHVMGLPPIDPPSYSTNITDAYRVVEKMRSLGYSFSLFEYASDGELQAAAECYFSKGVAYQPIIEGDTAPQAICKAALACIEKEASVPA